LVFFYLSFALPLTILGDVACVELGLKTADLLKLFNSRACQLVLGAGAVSMAGLKTITIRSPLITVVLSFFLTHF